MFRAKKAAMKEREDYCMGRADRVCTVSSIGATHLTKGIVLIVKCVMVLLDLVEASTWRSRNKLPNREETVYLNMNSSFI